MWVESIERRSRAHRYCFASALLYRAVGERTWREGRTVNVSTSGFLFIGEAPPLATATPLEAIVDLPASGVCRGSRFHCTGRVVRIGDVAGTGRAAMASTIEDYRLLKMVSASM